MSQEEISALFNGAPAGIEFVKEGFSIAAYPNPTKNKINLNVDAKHLQENFKLMDQIGKCLWDGVISDCNTEIDLSNFASGIYFIQVGNQNKETIKIVKE